MLTPKSMIERLSMLPFNFKPLIIWVSVFLSFGFYSAYDALVVKLSEMVMFQFEQTSLNVLIFTVLVGIVAPVFSVIAALFLFCYLYSAVTSVSQSSAPDTTPKNHKTDK